MDRPPPERLPAASYLRTHGHPQPSIAAVVCYLMLGWRPDAISRETLVPVLIIYEWQRNLMRYSSAARPHTFIMGWSKKLSRQNEIALLNWLLQEKWHMQNEMIYWLWNEHKVLVNQSTISHLLCKNKWLRKKLQWISLNHSEMLRQLYHDEMSQFAAENLIFLDESIFNEKTGW